MLASINMIKKMQMGSNWVCILNRKQMETILILQLLNSGSWKFKEMKTWKYIHNLRIHSQFCVYKSCFQLLWLLLRCQPVPISGPQSKELWAETKLCSPGRSIFLEFCKVHESSNY